MHLGGHLLRVRVVAAGQLFQVQAEVTRHDTLGREIGQAHVVQDPTARTSRLSTSFSAIERFSSASHWCL